MKVVPFNFSQEHKEMLGKAKLLLEEKRLAIHPSFDKLITSLSTAVATENDLDKEAIEYDNIIWIRSDFHYVIIPRGVRINLF